MKFDRRTFLKQTGSILLSLGLSGIRLERDRSALAQTTNRKLALLVGINSYPDSSLNGCLTDIELQRELLIHRFGFSDRDILILTEQKATRENIETAFIEHLNKQAKADDVVVFHFSGYGDRVKIPTTLGQIINDNSEPNYQLVNSLIPANGNLTIEDRIIADRMLEDTLMLLTRSLNTDKLTTILDTSYINASKPLQGNLRLRSHTSIAEEINPEELAFSEQLRLNLASRKSFGHAIGSRTIQTPITQRIKSLPPAGVLLTAGGKGEIATETSWDGFSAGLFTYALTQYLWQVTPASKIQVAIARTAETVGLITSQQQQPILRSETKPLLMYHSMPINSVGAEGVVTGIDDKGMIKVRLLGLPANVLRHYGNNSLLELDRDISMEENNAIVPAQLQIQSREGLIAKTQLTSSSDRQQLPKIGQLVRENVRVLSRHLPLSIALDANLDRIERVDATSAFSSLGFISTTVDAGTQTADCLLGKIEKPSVNNSNDSSSSTSITKSGYGLLSVTGTPIASTVGSSKEAVKSAVTRLTPQLKTLLADKLYRMTINENSSCLTVSIILESITNQEQKPKPLIEKRTVRSLGEPEILSANKSSFFSEDLESNAYLPVITKGDRWQVRVTNSSDRPIYIMLFGLDSNNEAFALYSPNLNTNSESQLNIQQVAIDPQANAIFPDPSNFIPSSGSSSSDLVKIYAICSIAPFIKTFAALSTQPNLKQDREQFIDLLNPLEVSQALLEDLHTASATLAEKSDFSSSVYALNVKAWATLDFALKLLRRT